MKERIFWLVCVIITGLVAAFFWMTGTESAQKLAGADGRNAQHLATIDSLRERALLEPKVVGVKSNLHKSDILLLKRKGLKQPVDEIAKDLVGRRDLIPIDGVLGGTMAFAKSEMVILNDKWVIASFDDGHMFGRALLEYEVSEDGKISWGMIAYDIP